MKNLFYFIRKIIVFCIPLILYFTANTIYKLENDRYQKEVYGHEVYSSIQKSKKRTKIKKLIIGDSTANQLYNTESDTTSGIYTLACNQAIGMVGHFLLLNNYLKAGNRPEDVYLIYNPLGYWDNLDQIYTYHYFLKPFYKKEYKPFFTKTVIEQIHKIPYYYICDLPPVYTSSWAPEKKDEKRNYTFLSPVSKEYLAKIDSLSKAYVFNLHYVSPFVSKYWRDSINSFNIDETKGYSFTKDLNYYMKNIKYIDDSCFSDHLHLHNRNLIIYRNILDKEIGI
jgi:hypothetical protein